MISFLKWFKWITIILLMILTLSLALDYLAISNKLPASANRAGQTVNPTISNGKDAVQNHEAVEQDEQDERPEIIINIENIALKKDYHQLIDYLLDLTQKITPQNAVIVADWLQLKESDGYAPYIYLRSLFLLKTKDKSRAFEVYQLAKLNARLDERRCNSNIAPLAKKKYEQGDWLAIEALIKKRAYLEHTADKMFAYNHELTMKNRSVAHWICTNNYIISANMDNLLTEQDWHDVRATFRAGYLSNN